MPSGTINSAAALGVGARRSVDKVANGKIDFVTDGRDDWHGGMEYRAGHDPSSNLPDRSSMLPPPRAITIKSTGRQFTLGRASSRIATAISAAAPAP